MEVEWGCGFQLRTDYRESEVSFKSRRNEDKANSRSPTCQLYIELRSSGLLASALMLLLFMPTYVTHTFFEKVEVKILNSK